MKVPHSQPHQIALFDYEITEKEFEVLVSNKLSEEELLGLNKNRVSVKVTSQFQNGKYINTYEFHLYKLSGEKIFRYDLSDNFESIRRIIYISINGGDIKYNGSFSINLDIDSSFRNAQSLKLRMIFQEYFPFSERLLSFSSEQSASTASGKEIDLMTKVNLSGGEKQVLAIGEFFIKNISSLINSIILIDEPEANLHPNWQKGIINFFDQIVQEVGDIELEKPQFIFTTHSPYFLENYLSRKSPIFVFKRNGNEDLVILDSSSFLGWSPEKILKETYHTDFFIIDSRMIFVEGETDEIYINKCIDVYGMYAFPFKIKWVGKRDEMGKLSFSGKSALDQLKLFLLANEELILYPVILLYDNDTNKEKERINKLRVEVMPVNASNNIYKIGIENLLQLPEGFDVDNFYSNKSSIDGYGAKKSWQEFRKMDLCLYLCSLPDEQAREVFRFMYDYLLTLCKE